MRHVQIVLLFIFALSVVVAKTEDAKTVQYVTVTQKVSRVFGNATDRQVDRIRLVRAATQEILGGVQYECVTNNVVGLKVECVKYISSNRVEAVFSRQINVTNGHP